MKAYIFLHCKLSQKKRIFHLQFKYLKVSLPTKSLCARVLGMASNPQTLENRFNALRLLEEYVIHEFYYKYNFHATTKNILSYAL